MEILINTILVVFILGWTAFGVWMVVKYAVLFGPHRDDPAESSGARALNVTQVASVWFGVWAVTFYFLFR